MFRFAAIACLLAAPAMAQDLTGDAIRSAIIGNTVQGSMNASGGYAEYYAPGGAIKAVDYAGSWDINGNEMCFSYGDDPALCATVRMTGDQVVWVFSGVEEGTGTIVQGNPNGW
jgi:hypothetical protein